MFLFIIAAILIGDAAWWLWADRKLSRVGRAKLWRILLAAFTAPLVAYILFFIIMPSQGRRAHTWAPVWTLSTVYLWHLLILPITFFLVIGNELTGQIAAAYRKFRPPPAAADPPQGPTRRQVLAAAMVAVPPILTVGAVARSLTQTHEFRIRRLEVPLAKLPRDLDGMTIAHVTDLHVGRFTRPHMLPRIADATNGLKADLTLLTGDLIDLSLVDLPAAIDFVHSLDPRRGLFTCEGNHDLIDNRVEFETRMLAADVPLLIDRTAFVTVRDVPIQILGLSWSRGGPGMIGAINRLLPHRRDELFQILLAHHPHAFDPAASIGIPLTLAGHTHGGQLMLNERLGAGPAMFKYYSGLYRQNDCALVVSNGVGNWFPLRVNAPAEIVHITLRSAQA
jgi:predicted MPP superfamily phosphohydrolase